MTEIDFEAHRGLVFGIAYRMLGTVSEAEDVVQETWLRIRKNEQPIDDVRAWLSTVATRLAIDRLREARRKREVYVGPWLPEPVVEGVARDPAELADSLSLAFLTLLERLNPVERAVFLLREVFDYDYGEVATIVGKTESACRQILKRARDHIDAARPRFEPDPQARERIVGEFFRALGSGDLSTMESLLADEVVWYSDGGGKAQAARNPITGRDKVLRFLVGLNRRAQEDTRYEPAHINGHPGFLIYVAGALYLALVAEVTDGRIARFFAIVNPDKLAHLTGTGGSGDAA